MRTLLVSVVATAGLLLAGGTAAAAVPTTGQDDARTTLGVLDYWQLHSTHPSLTACETEAEKHLYPNNPGGADDYECRENGGVWELWLIFAT